MKTLKFRKHNLLYILLVVVLFSCENKTVNSNEDSIRELIMSTYKKAWIDGANAANTYSWGSHDEGLKYFKKDSLTFVGLLYGN